MRGGPPGSLESIAGLKEEKAKDTGKVARRLLQYVVPFKREVALAMFFVILGAVTQALGPAIIGITIDQYVKPISEGGSTEGLLTNMGLLLIVYALGFVSSRYQIIELGILTQRILVSLRAQIFGKVQNLSLSYFDKNPAGDVMSRLVNDTDVINQFLGQGMTQVLGSIFGLTGIIIAMLVQSPLLAAVSLVVVPLMLLLTNVFSKLARRSYRKTRETIGDVSSDLQEEIAGAKVAQAFNRTKINEQRFAVRNAANRDANVNANAVTSAFTPLIDVLATLATAIVAGFGGYLAIQGQVSVGIVVAFLSYVQNLFRPLQAIGTIYTQAQSALAGAERIFDLVDSRVDVEDKPGAKPIQQIKGEVKFDHVSFAYDAKKPVLNEVTFTAQPGQTVAIVGPTGAGKTTIINLIQRFYDVTDGAVFIDGVDVRDVTQASLRAQMGVVPQDSFLFSASIADNIRYGKLDATDADVENAAKAANADGFIANLKDKYQTVLGERGTGLSQGQRQLLGIARAVLANPRILILDEATSSVDTRTEQLIQQALGKLLKGRTSFVIAHRLSTIRDADVVLVVQEGQIVERGKHEALLAQNGVYADLYRRQFRTMDAAKEK
ncbi:MAG: ABC transporter ATP-binding protein [Anaerolineae bacterium]|nr:ABC transporter ATP-binding protein [Anaerolineae bacterium]